MGADVCGWVCGCVWGGGIKGHFAVSEGGRYLKAICLSL